MSFGAWGSLQKIIILLEQSNIVQFMVGWNKDLQEYFLSPWLEIMLLLTAVHKTAGYSSIPKTAMHVCCKLKWMHFWFSSNSKLQFYHLMHKIQYESDNRDPYIIFGTKLWQKLLVLIPLCKSRHKAHAR